MGAKFKNHVEMDQREREERAARVRSFLVSADEGVVADLFETIRDAVADKEADEIFYITKYYAAFNRVLSEVESDLCTV